MHGEKIYYELFRSLTRPAVSDVYMKARCQTGFTVTEYIGGQMSAQVSQMQYAQVDADKVFTFAMRNDQSFKEDQPVYF